MLVEKLNNLIQDEKDAIVKWIELIALFEKSEKLLDLGIDATIIKFRNFLKDEQNHLKRLESILSLVLKSHID